jgi:hypothetical protein
MNVIDALFATEFREDGTHAPMTLPEYASQYLADIEHRFGPRDRSFALVGIDIDKTPGNVPRTWFPDSGIAPDDGQRRSRHVVIRLGPAAITDLARARWQLAHECVHLLDPWNKKVDGRTTNWLEEGLAAWYQNYSVPEAEFHEDLYATAEDLVTPLMDELPHAIKRIRQERGLRIGEIPPDILRVYCSGMSEETAWKLCQPFSNQIESPTLDTAIEGSPTRLGFGTGE